MEISPAASTCTFSTWEIVLESDLALVGGVADLFYLALLGHVDLCCRRRRLGSQAHEWLIMALWIFRAKISLGIVGEAVCGVVNF